MLLQKGHKGYLTKSLPTINWHLHWHQVSRCSLFIQAGTLLQWFPTFFCCSAQSTPDVPPHVNFTSKSVVSWVFKYPLWIGEVPPGVLLHLVRNPCSTHRHPQPVWCWWVWRNVWSRPGEQLSGNTVCWGQPLQPRCWPPLVWWKTWRYERYCIQTLWGENKCIDKYLYLFKTNTFCFIWLLSVLFSKTWWA